MEKQNKPSPNLEAAITRIYDRMQSSIEELANTIEKALTEMIAEKLKATQQS